MAYNFNNDRPIYVQLVEQLELYIISGKISLGERLPSVRDFAYEYKVNPNTMQKALIELEDKELIYTERTNGKFVTTNKKILNKYRDRLVLDKIDGFLNDMKDIGFTKEEIINRLEDRRMD